MTIDNKTAEVKLSHGQNGNVNILISIQIALINFHAYQDTYRVSM